MLAYIPNAAILMHIAGPSGSGKSTILQYIKERYPNLITKDLDEIDDVAKAELGIIGRKRNWSDKKLTNFYAKKQEVFDRFLAKNKGKRIILAGHHIPGAPDGLVNSWTLIIPRGKKILLNTGKKKSALRRLKRSIARARKNLPPTKANLSQYRAEGKKDIKNLKALGYKKKSPKKIIKMLDKLIMKSI